MSRLRKQVIALAWPAVLHGLLITVVLFTDRLILGNYRDDALASMQVCGPVLWSLFSVFGAYGAGLLAVVGRAYGAKDITRVQSALGSGLLIGLAAGTVIGVLGFLARDSITTLIATGDAATETVRGMASTYMGIVLLAAPVQMAGSSATVSLQALGDTRTPMLVSILSGAVNLGVSLVLVFGYLGLPQLGITGAAIGTVASIAAFRFS